MKDRTATRMIRILALISACLMFFYSTVAIGCECRDESANRAIARLRKTATVIFVGTVTEIKKEVRDYHVGLWATFKVERSWKTNPIDHVSVFTEGGCMAWFESGKTYLVYASPDESNRLSTNICMRTRLLEYAKEDLKRLGKPRFIAERIAPKQNGSKHFTVVNSVPRFFKSRHPGAVREVLRLLTTLR